MYVDASQLFSNHFYITYGDPAKGLVSPAEMDFDIQPECSAMNPKKFGTKGTQSFVMLCKGKSSWTLDFLPMEKQ